MSYLKKLKRIESVSAYALRYSDSFRYGNNTCSLAELKNFVIKELETQKIIEEYWPVHDFEKRIYNNETGKDEEKPLSVHLRKNNSRLWDIDESDRIEINLSIKNRLVLCKVSYRPRHNIFAKPWSIVFKLSSIKKIKLMYKHIDRKFADLVVSIYEKELLEIAKNRIEQIRKDLLKG